MDFYYGYQDLFLNLMCEKSKRYIVCQIRATDYQYSFEIILVDKYYRRYVFGYQIEWKNRSSDIVKGLFKEREILFRKLF